MNTMESCDPANMFAGIQDMLENQNQESNMPVRKFYKNTFGDLLNGAIFALTKKQGQTPDNHELFTTEGMIKFVAFQLLDSPPDGEIQQDQN